MPKMPFTREQRNEISDIIKETVMDTINDEVMDKIMDKVSRKFEIILEKHTKETQEALAKLKNDNERLTEDLDNLQQYSRRTSIRIFGLTENAGKRQFENIIENREQTKKGHPPPFTYQTK